jgi:glycosyltransferase involved in cell wall biosynthesis
MKKIAVLIPTYKAKEYYLKRCLDSLEKQTLDKNQFCVYIALNGAKNPYENELLEMLASYTFKYKYMYIKESGVSNARNELINCSNEPFVAFIDDDDVISNNYLSELLTVSTKEHIGIAKVYNFKKDINTTIDNYLNKAYDKFALLESSKLKTRKYYSPICAKLIHRDIIGNIKFDTSLRNGEDSLFMATISKNVKKLCKPSEEVCYYIYERPNSASRKKISLNIRMYNYIYLIKEYSKLLFSTKYEKLFILTRILATIKKLIYGYN